MWSPQRSMDNTDKCIQIYELSVNTTSRMIYVFAKDRTCPLPVTALPHSDSSVHTINFDALLIVLNQKNGELQVKIALISLILSNFKRIYACPYVI